MNMIPWRTVVAKSINVVFSLFCVWLVLHVSMWLLPQDKWLNIAMTAIFALDMALITSGIAPNGVLGRRKRD
jgi:hypothetical protein